MSIELLAKFLPSICVFSCGEGEESHRTPLSVGREANEAEISAFECTFGA